MLERLRRIGRDPEPNAIEHRLQNLHDPVINAALELSRATLSHQMRKQPFPQEKSLYEHSLEVAGQVLDVYPLIARPKDNLDIKTNAMYRRYIAVALLHDVIEDGEIQEHEDVRNVTYDDLLNHFDKVVVNDETTWGDVITIAEDVMYLSEIKHPEDTYMTIKHNYNWTIDQVRMSHIAAISAADKYINIRDMNRAFAQLQKSTGSDRMARAIHYAGFFGTPKESREFYKEHNDIVNNKLSGDRGFARLLRRYNRELVKWMSIFTPHEFYEKHIDDEHSAEIRRMCRTFSHSIHTLSLPYDVIPVGSVGYGACVRASEDNGQLILNNCNFVLCDKHTMTPVLPDRESYEGFIIESQFSQALKDLLSNITAYCNDNNIQINPDTLFNLHYGYDCE